MELNKLQSLNREIKIYSANDISFSKYGKIVNGYNFSELDDYMYNNSLVPTEMNTYVASVECLEKTDLKKKLETNFYGGIEVQIGYCNGNNSQLNGLEYHKVSEINYAITDLVLLVANIWDINDNKISSEKVKGFFIPKGTAVELYGTTLHFAPCKLNSKGFKCIVILPKSINTDHKYFDDIAEEDNLLFMKGKWLIVHNEAKHLIAKGAFSGIEGKNIEVKF